MLLLPPVWVALALTIAPVRMPLAVRPADPSMSVARADSIMASASVALAHGRPWEASRIIAEVLADTARRTPDALILAATAASRWGGWPEVTHLLRGQPWLDTAYGGRGRLLLARAALQQGDDSVALVYALATPASSIDSVDGERLVLLATALERLHARDSAATTYTRAADRLPTIAGWLRIRAAATTDDSATRAALYAGVADPLARDRIGWSEAAAHAGAGDLEGAATRYAGLGARVTALRLRLAASPDSAWRASVRTDLMAVVAAHRSPGETRDAIALVDSAFTPLAPAEELAVGRAAATAGSYSRAVAAFERAFADSLGDAGGPLRLRHRAHPARPLPGERAAVRPGARAAGARRVGGLSGGAGAGARGPGGQGKGGADPHPSALPARHHRRVLRALPARRPGVR